MKKKLRILSDVILGPLAVIVIYGVVRDGTNDLLNALSDKPVFKTLFYALAIWMVCRAITLFIIWEDHFTECQRNERIAKETQERWERERFFNERNRVN